MIHDRLVHTDQALGKKRSFTPEGFLLCEDVPIARTGIQEYLNEELIGDGEDEKIEGGKNGIIKAERNAADVFRPETLASFEGKPVVDDHPDDTVGPHNFKEHVVGITLNPRRGTDDLENFILADLLIMDQDAIDAIDDGKVEVSCGYDAEYEPLGPGKVRQYNIVGNHVALVDRGRCGHKCSIGDKAMPKKITLMDRIYKAIKSKDSKALDAALKDAEEVPGMNEEGIEPNDKTDNEIEGAEGIHIHLHGVENGGTESSADPALADAPDTGEAAGAMSVEDRMTALEQSLATVVDAIKKIAGGAGGGNEAPPGEGEDPEAEAEGEGENTPPAQEGEEENEKEEFTGDEDMPTEEAANDEDYKEGEEGASTVKDKKGTKDGKTVKDSSGLKDMFAAVKSGAEIIAPGIKMPVFDKAAAARTTMDNVCLLKRRSLAASARTNDGAEMLELVTGSKKLKPGMACDSLGVVFNAVVAMTKDKNDITKIAPVKTLFGRSKVQDENKTRYAGVKTPADFNAANRARFGQPSRH